MRNIVVGGGFRGIATAYLLAKKGQDVTLIDAAPKLGGVLRPIKWGAYLLDKGCHLFDNSSDSFTDFIWELGNGNFAPLTVNYASISGGQTVNGLAIPTFLHLPQATSAVSLLEIAQASHASSDGVNHSLAEALVQRFGPTLYPHVAAAFLKAYSVRPEAISANALPQTMFQRIQLFDRQTSLLFKQAPYLDDRLGVSSAADPLEFYRDKVQQRDFRNFYPTLRGFDDFLDIATSNLRSSGVSLHLGAAVNDVLLTPNDARVSTADGQSFEADRLFWTLPKATFTPFCAGRYKLDTLTEAVPMVLMYFAVKSTDVTDITYIHNYDAAEIAYRISTPGSYIDNLNTAPPGYSYICCEVVTPVGSAYWQDIAQYRDQLWQEVIQSEIVTPTATYVDSVHYRVPKTYSLAKPGYLAELEQLKQELAQYAPFVWLDTEQVGKSTIYTELQGCLL